MSLSHFTPRLPIPTRPYFLFLLMGALLAPASAAETQASLLSKDMEEITRSAVPTPGETKTQICETLTATLSRHVNLQPNGISATVYQSGKTRIHVQWKDFSFQSFQPAPIDEVDRLNGVTSSFMINFHATAYRTWKEGSKGWSKWNSARYKTFPHGVRVKQSKGRWATKHHPMLKYFSPGPGTSVFKPAQPATNTGLPPGMTRKP